MKRETVKALCSVTARFYEEQAASFSATRQAPWPGWRRCLPAIEGVSRQGESGVRIAALGDGDAEPATSDEFSRRRLSVLDLGCGNMRFEAFLARELPKAALSFCAVDACEPLMHDAAHALPDNVAVRFASCDAAAVLLDNGALGFTRRFGDGAFDVAVAFGFLHHLPTADLRVAAFRALVGCTRTGGVVAVSLWRFLDDPTMARKADVEHAHACATLAASSGKGRADDGAAIDLSDFEQGDRLLGWKGAEGAFRFCHSFSDDDVAMLVKSVADRADPVDRFRSDGRTGDLNEYLVFRVR